MRKFIVFLISCVILCGVTGFAYDKNNLPKYLSFSEAIGIKNAADIQSAEIINLDEGKVVSITQAKARLLFNGLKGMKMERIISPTPFSGIAISFKTDDSVVGFYTNSGIQIGKFGQNNFVCYVPSEINEYIANVRAAYYEADKKSEMYSFPIVDSIDFLKLPKEDWAVSGVEEAAGKSLLPYILTDDYEAGITREEFCVLIGNMIAVCDNYKSIEDYMKDNNTVYQKNDFIDCEDADEAVDILHTLGIVNGKSAKTFEPYANVTREEAAKIISLSAELFMPLYTNGKMSFTDASSISEWARFYTSWCNEHKIMMGDENADFNPKANITVSEAIITIDRLYNLIQSL